MDRIHLSLFKYIFPLIVLSLIIPFGLSSNVFAEPGDFLGGDGTDNTPYIICDCEGITNVNISLDKSFLLANDLDCSASGNSIMIGNGENPFVGKFDGGGYTLTVNINTENAYTALFPIVDGGQISNLRLSGNVTGGLSTAGLVGGLVNNSIISNVVNTASINCSGGVNAGGIVATTFDQFGDPIIEDSYNIGNVTGNSTQNVGGIVGLYNGGIITRTYNRGEITAPVYVGGLVGRFNRGTVRDSFNVGKLTPLGWQYGALVGNVQNTGLPNTHEDTFINNYFDTSRTFLSHCWMDQNGLTQYEWSDECESVNNAWSDVNWFKENDWNRPFVDQSDSQVWDFENIWDTEVGGYPSLQSIINDGGPTNDEIDVPDAPSDLTHDGFAGDYINLEWTTPNNHYSSIDNYKIAYRIADSEWIEMITDDSNNYYELLNLNFDTEYEIKVSAHNNEGWGEYSESIFITTLEQPRVPSIPLDLSLSLNEDPSYFDLTWTIPEDEGTQIINGYIVQVKVQEDDWNIINSTFYIDGNTDFANNLGPLSFGKAYDIRLSAVSDVGNGLPSTSVTFETPEANTHLIKNCSNSIDEEDFGLQGMNNSPSTDRYLLNNDIDCGGETVIIESFSGIFDGQNHRIYNLGYTASTGNAGLFLLLENAQIINLDLEGTAINATNGTVGALASTVNGGVRIENVTSNIAISSNQVWGVAGGLIGEFYTENGTLLIRNSHTTGNVDGGNDSAGGLIGQVELDNCYSTGLIIDNSSAGGDIESITNTGGLMGTLYAGCSMGVIITDSSYDGGTISSEEAAGGLIGHVEYYANSATLEIDGSYSLGSLVSDTSAGGLIGEYLGYEDIELNISDSHSLMAISNSNNTGGLMGRMYINGDYANIIIENSYYNSNGLEGEYATGGLIGYVNLNASNDQLLINNSYTEGIVVAQSYTGGFVGMYESYSDTQLTVTNSNSIMSITGDYATGGLFGYIYFENYDLESYLNKIENCYFVGVINQTDAVGGGLIGQIADDSYGHSEFLISKSYVDGDINGIGTMGGLVGRSEYLKLDIQDSYSSININGEYNLGGLLGNGYGSDSNYPITINNSYSVGDISLNTTDPEENGIGGLIGYSGSDISVTNSFSASKISTNDVNAYLGGLIGLWDGNFINFTNNYFDVNASTISMCGHNDDIEGCTGINFDNSDPSYLFDSDNSPFSDTWDFNTIWQTNVDDYPTLRTLPHVEPIEPSVPGQVLDLNVIASAEVDDIRYIDLTWASPENDGGRPLIGYTIQIKEQQDDWDLLNSSYFVDSDYTNISEIGPLSYGKSYDIRIFATNTIGNGLPSEAVEYVLPDAPIHIIKNCTNNVDEDDFGLQGMNGVPNFHSFVLNNDIDCDGENVLINIFTGSFDGQNHRIYNFGYDFMSPEPGSINIVNTISPTYMINTGLFATLENATIKNLIIEGSNLTTNFGSIGALAGKVIGGARIENVSSNINVGCFGEGYAGGLIGEFSTENGSLIIKNSYVTGDIDGYAYASGGLIGYSNMLNMDGLGLTIDNSYVGGSINGSYSSGGLIGQYYAGNGSGVLINDSYYSGLTVIGGEYVGGLVGDAEVDEMPDIGLTIDNSYSEGDLYANNNAGGLIGRYSAFNIDSLTINDSHSSMNINASSQVGGLVGGINMASTGSSVLIDNSYSEGVIDTDGILEPTGIEDREVGGLIGSYYDNYDASLIISNSHSTTDIASANYDIGGVIGTVNIGSSGGTILIENTYSSGLIDMYGGVEPTSGGVANVGGIIGSYKSLFNTSLVLNNVYSIMNIINTTFNTGGLIGSMELENSIQHTLVNKIESSYYAGDIITLSTGAEFNGHGGLIGNIFDFTEFEPSTVDNLGPNTIYNGFLISKSYSQGSIDASNNVGGLIGHVGYLPVEIQNSYSQMDITANGTAGGLIGVAHSDDSESPTTINNSYSSGDISVNADYNSVGGLVGSSGSYTTITNSFSASSIITDAEVYLGAIAGQLYGEVPLLDNNYFDVARTGYNFCVQNSPIEGCTEINSDGNDSSYFFDSNNSPFSNTWNFSTIWRENGEDYPVLRVGGYPIITILGDNPSNITVGNTYNDAGATAQDAEDGDVTDDIVMTGSVNTNAIGTYYINYDICDSDINCAETQTRTVNVVAIDVTVVPTQISSPTITPTRRAVVTVEPTYTATPEIIISLDLFNDYLNGIGKSLGLIINNIVTFIVDNVQHTGTIKEIGDNYILITFASTPKEVMFEINDTKSIDVDGDGVNDIQVTLDSITNGQANLIFKQLKINTLPETGSDNIEKTVKPTGNTTSIQEIENTNSDNTIMYTVLGAFVLLGVSYIIFKKRSNNNEN